MASAGTVTLNLDANSVKLLRELQKSQRATQRAASNMQRRMGNAFRTIRTTVLSATTALAAFGAFRGFDRIAGEVDKIGKLVDRLGGSTEAFSELRFVASQSGVAFNTLTMGLQRMQRRVAEAAVDMGEAQGALKELGLSARQLVGLSIDQQFEIIADALSQVGVEADQTRLAMKLFDSEGVALLQTMNEGAAGIQRLRREAESLGFSLSNQQVQAATDAKDAMDSLSTATTALSEALAVRLAPAIAKVTQGLANMVSGNRMAEIANRMDVIRENLRFYAHDADMVRVLTDEFGRLAEELQNLEHGPQGRPELPIPEIVIDEQGLREGQRRIQKAYQEMAKGAAEGLDDDFITPFRHRMFRLPPATRQAYDEMQEISKQAARNMQDAFADFLFDPFEDGLKGMLKSFLDTIRRMLANKLAVQLFEGLGFGDWFGGPKAAGGAVTAGRAYLVGEKGPELMVPGASGTIIPNDKLAGGGVNVTYNINAPGADAGVIARMVPLLERTKEATIAEVRQLKTEGRL